MHVNVIQQRWSLEEMKAHYRAEILEASESRGIKIDQLTTEARTSGNNKGHFVEYRATYPNKPVPVKHTVFAIPGPEDQTILFSAVSLEEGFEELRADWDAPLGSVTIDWARLPQHSPPRRGIGYGMALGVLLGSVLWLLIRKRGQKK
jgi:hypothetical protein